MIKRELQSVLLSSLGQFPVIGLVGSRQTGKTTLAKALAKKWKTKTVYIDLELPSDAAKLDEPEFYLEHHKDKLVILDEIQRKPGLFPLLRSLVDKSRKNGRFLILGSASPNLIRQASESLAGRIIYHELTPLTMSEIKSDTKKMRELWNRGGYPLSFLASSEKASFSWREAFINTYLERDIPLLGIKVPTAQLRRFWQMLAHVHGHTWNASQIAKSMDVSAPTARHYLDILQDIFVIRQLQPFYQNVKKRLVKSPKIYLRDSGILHALLNIRNPEELSGHPSLGFSWEGWVIEQILSAIPSSWTPYFYRSGGGAELDLVLQSGRERPIAIEIKYSAAPKLQKGFWNAFADLKCKKGFVIYPGNEFYPIRKNVFALPINMLYKLR